jgi:RNA polymerase sigma-70 factor (ECF subfamily)
MIGRIRMIWPSVGRRAAEFEEVALVHLDALYRGALRLTRNRAQAEDLVQEALVRAFRSFDRFTAGTNCRAWLFKIMRNVFLNQRRRERETPHEVEFFEHQLPEDLERVRPAAPTPEDEFLQTVVHGDVDRALQSLPERFRDAVVLCDIEGFSYREIAEALECPIGTVMSRLSRGRRLLRLALDGFARERGNIKE